MWNTITAVRRLAKPPVKKTSEKSMRRARLTKPSVPELERTKGKHSKSKQKSAKGFEMEDTHDDLAIDDLSIKSTSQEAVEGHDLRQQKNSSAVAPESAALPANRDGNTPISHSSDEDTDEEDSDEDNGGGLPLLNKRKRSTVRDAASNAPADTDEDGSDDDQNSDSDSDAEDSFETVAPRAGLRASAAAASKRLKVDFDEDMSSGSNFELDDDDDDDEYDVRKESALPDLSKAKLHALISAETNAARKKALKGNDDEMFSDYEEDVEDDEHEERPDEITLAERLGLRRRKNRSRKKRVISDDPVAEHDRRYRHRVSRPSNMFNPYLMFSKEARPRIQKENPNIPSTELVKRVAEEYRALPEDKKKELKEKALELKRKFNQERGYRERNKRMPGNGYVLFYRKLFHEVRAEHPEYKLEDINKIASIKWKALDPDVKEKYIEESRIARMEFEKANPEFVQQARESSRDARKRTRERRVEVLRQLGLDPKKYVV
ncbi:hypothetical protein BX666DRAFT_1917508 [Dichotomocladium elegans]|nr:hypothetical protein BX666DRAFT_1917508 [Dichotomocladium elegans]